MSSHRRSGHLSSLLVLLLAAGPVSGADVDADTGLKGVGDWQLVRANCVSCHSAKLITQQRAGAEQWRKMIRWMQKEHNLWQFDPTVEQRILDYLAESYPPRAERRRAPIPPGLMPSRRRTPAAE